MKRTIKKLLYGGFYSILFFIFVFGFYNIFLKAAPTCFDGIKNQNETGIDCGGIRPLCILTELSPLELKGAVKVFGLSSGRVVFLADVLNSNSYGADAVPYEFLVYDRSGDVIEKIKGSYGFAPLERKFIYESNAQSIFSEISRVDLVFTAPAWKVVTQLPKSDVVLAGSVNTMVSESSVVVTGRVSNRGLMSVSALKILAVLSNRFGNEIFAAQTVLNDFRGFEERDFSILIPADPGLKKEFDPEATKVFFSVQ